MVSIRYSPFAIRRAQGLNVARDNTSRFAAAAKGGAHRSQFVPKLAAARAVLVRIHRGLSLACCRPWTGRARPRPPMSNGERLARAALRRPARLRFNAQTRARRACGVTHFGESH